MSNQRPAYTAPKVGDRVICIDAEASFNRLCLHGEYTVTANFDGSPTVEVNGSTHMMERFVLKSEFEQFKSS